MKVEVTLVGRSGVIVDLKLSRFTAIHHRHQVMKSGLIKNHFLKHILTDNSNSLTTVFVEIKYLTHAFMKFTIIT